MRFGDKRVSDRSGEGPEMIERASEVGNGSWVIGWLSPNDWAACQKVGCFWTGFF